MNFTFDTVIDRSQSDSLKWGFRREMTGEPDILPMWVADMDFTPPPAVVQAVQQRAAHPIYGYAERSPEYAAAVTVWMERRFHWRVEPEWLVLTPGVVPALHFAVQAFTAPDERVVIQTPVYFPFFLAAQRQQRELVFNPLRREGAEYRMDFAHLEACLDERTRLLVLCSPHNPVGRCWRRDELAELAEICRRRGVIVFSDEIHADLIMPGHRHTPLAALAPEMDDFVVTATSPSKTFNLAGMQAANIVIPNQELRRRFHEAVMRAGLHLLNPFALAAVPAAYRHGEPWLEELLVYLQGNYRLVCDFLAERLPAVRVSPLESTYLMWLDFSALGRGDSELVDLLRHRAKVWLDEGTRFGPGGEGFQRLNIACPRTVLRQGLERITAALAPTA